MVVTQSLSPQSYIDSSLILLAYAVALSKAVLLLVMSLKRIACGDLARIRRLGNGGGGDGVRGTALVLWDLVEGVRGKDEYLFKLVSTPPLRLGSEGLSSVGDPFMLEDEPFSASGLASSKAWRPPSDGMKLESFELLIQLLCRRSSGERAVLGVTSSLAGCTVIAGAESRITVGGLGN
jgi:hypothetical protein